MSMHMVRGLSTNNTRRRKQKRKPGDVQLQAAHDQWLRKRGVHPDQLKTKEKRSGNSVPDYTTTRSTIPTSNTIVPIQERRNDKVYTGDYIIGIATLHKSNLVPVGRGDNPEVYAKMRR